MQVSVESTNGLERKLVVNVPSEKIENMFGSRINELAKKVKLDGFRPGKVPVSVVKQRFGDSIKEEIARELMQSSLFEAIREKGLEPAGMPAVEQGALNVGEDFEFTATFEVMPEIEFKELEGVEVEQLLSEVTDAEIQQMIDRLLEQNKEWHAVDRASQSGDKIIIDFEGFVDGEAFEGGKAEKFELELGSGSMIPGFESQLENLSKETDTEIQVTFPEDYGQKDLAAKDATFKIKVHEVQEAQLPKLDDEFVKRYDVKEGGVDAFLADVRKNMTKELEKQLGNQNKDKVFQAFKEINPCDVPSVLVQNEISALKKDMIRQVFGDQKIDESKLPNLPDDMFTEKATNRVHIGLLFSEYVKKNSITADAQRVTDWLEKMANTYDQPEDVLEWYRSSKERMSEVESVVLEEQVCEKMLEKATIVERKVDYEEAMNPPAPQSAAESAEESKEAEGEGEV